MPSTTRSPPSHDTREFILSNPPRGLTPMDNLRRHGRNPLQAQDLKKGHTGHWTYEQSHKYYAFLCVHSESFERRGLRRSEKIFKLMALFVESRTADQCRSHHQKMEKKWASFESILSHLSYYRSKKTDHEAMIEECKTLRNQQREDESLGSEEIKLPEISTQTPSTFDLAPFQENGYYVMPLLIVPCSQTMFKAYFQTRDEGPQKMEYLQAPKLGSLDFP